MVGVIASASSAAAATTGVVLARAAYVTDLTSTGAYINWGITGVQTAGSVMVQPAPSSGSCPTSIAWDPNKQIAAPTTVPLINVPAKTTTTSWSYTVNSTSEWQESVPVTGLQPGTQYCYSAYDAHSGAPAQLGVTGTFTTLDPQGSTASLTFDVIGDTGETQSSPGVDYPGHVNPGQQAIYSEIGNSGGKFLLMAGDVAYSGGTQNNYGDLNQSGVEISDMFGPSAFPLANGIPTFVSDGNHGQNSNALKIWPEPQSALSSNGAYDFNAAAPNNDGIAGSFPEDWYAFSDGNVRIYVLLAAWADSADGTTANALCANNTTYWSSASDCKGYQADYDQHWTPNSAEYQWLKSDLAAHPGGVKMAVFHYPLRSDESTQASNPYLLDDPALNPSGYTSSLESLLAANGVKIAFNGHAHTYQRIVPSAPGTVANFITGGGGGILEPVGTSGNPTCRALIASGSVYAIGWSPTKLRGTACGTSNTPTSAMQVFSYLQVKVTGGLVTVTAYNAQNVAFDQYQFTYNVGGPSSPTNLRGTAASPTEVDLSWNSSSGGSSVAGYKVLRNGTVAGTTSGTSYADTGLTSGTTYTYTVEAFDAAGNLSAPSNAVQVATPADTQPPTSPQGLQGTAGSPSEVDLTWSASTDNVGVAGYKVLRGGTVVGTSLVTAYADTGLSANTPYTYTVEAFDAAGNLSAPSNSVQVATPADTQPPTSPQGLQGNAVSPSEVDLTWSPSTDNVGVSGYNVLRNGAVIGTTSGTSYADTGLSSNTAYSYAVEAFDAAGNVSAPSSAVQVTTPVPAQFTFVQSSLDGTGKTLTMPSPTTAGDLLVLSASVYSGSTGMISAVQDSAGDSWTRVIGSNVSGHYSDGEMWYTVTKASVTIISITTSASNVAARVLEFHGLGPSPTVTATGNAATGTTASAAASGSGVAVGFIAGHSNSQTINPSPGFVTQPQETTASPYVSVVTGYNLPASGTQSFGGTFSASMYWAAGVAVFSP